MGYENSCSARAPTACMVAVSAHCRSSIATRTAWRGLTCSSAPRRISMARSRWSGEARSCSRSAALSSGGCDAASAWNNGPHGVTWSSSSAAPFATTSPCSPAISAAAARSVDLPMPTSPSTRTTPPAPLDTALTTSCRTASSPSRPRTARIRTLSARHRSAWLRDATLRTRPGRCRAEDGYRDQAVTTSISYVTVSLGIVGPLPRRRPRCPRGPAGGGRAAPFPSCAG